jgi:hypothetical protein
MATDQTIFRVASRHKPYAILGNAMLQDKRLSIAARGLLGSIMSRPANWRFHIGWLMAEHNIGRDKTYRLIRELMSGGYCVRTQERTACGGWGPIEYAFTDDPQGVPAPPLPENPDTANPHAANQEALERRISHKQQTGTKEKAPELHVMPSGTDGATVDRLPFTAAVLAEIAALGVDVAAVVDRYRRRTAGKRIADPSAYLLRMARDEAAKRLDVPVAALAGLVSRNRAERASALATSVGAIAEPSPDVLRGLARRARARGDDPDAVIAAWRCSVRGLPVRNPDRSLLAFANQRALNRACRETVAFSTS